MLTAPIDPFKFVRTPGAARRLLAIGLDDAEVITLYSDGFTDPAFDTPTLGQLASLELRRLTAAADGEDV